MEVGYGEKLVEFGPNNKKSVILFGCGSGLDKFLYRYSLDSVKYIVDNNKSAIGTEKYGLKVFPPTKLLNEKKEEVIILITSSFVNQISKQLSNMGFKKDLHYFYAVPLNPSISKVTVDQDNNLKIYNANRFLSKSIGIEKLFNILNNRQIRYVVLRFFEKLPKIKKGEDIDLLIHDDDLSKIEDLFDSIPSDKEDIPFDIYSISGKPGSNYAGIPYYLPNLAKKILEERILYKEKFYVPSSKNYLFSLIYHIVYHKGEKSGLPVESDEAAMFSHSTRNYKKILNDKLEKHKYDLSIDLMTLHRFLKVHHWAPGIDTIRKLSLISDSKWVSRLDNNGKPGEVMAFILRDRTIKLGLKNYIVDWLEKRGLNVLGVKQLSLNEKFNFTNRVRGGNWKRESYPVNGGFPNTIIVVFDSSPIVLTEKQKGNQKFVKNGNFFQKDKLRADINEKFALNEQFNSLHSSDDETEALEYLNMINKSWRNTILNKIKAKRAELCKVER